MKTVSTLLQTLALLACFTAQAASGGEFSMPGVRRAMQTMGHSVNLTATPELASAAS